MASEDSEKIRKVCPDALILMDIPGVKPRTNNKVAVEIQAGQDVVFEVQIHRIVDYV